MPYETRNTCYSVSHDKGVVNRGTAIQYHVTHTYQTPPVQRHACIVKALQQSLEACLAVPGSVRLSAGSLALPMFLRSAKVQGHGPGQLPAREDQRGRREPEAARLDARAAGAVVPEDLGHRVRAPLCTPASWPPYFVAQGHLALCCTSCVAHHWLSSYCAQLAEQTGSSSPSSGKQDCAFGGLERVLLMGNRSQCLGLRDCAGPRSACRRSLPRAGNRRRRASRPSAAGRCRCAPSIARTDTHTAGHSRSLRA